MKDKKENININENCFSEETLLKFLNDELSEQETDKVQSHLVECELCSSFIEGILRLENSQEYFEIKQNINNKTDKIIEKQNKRSLMHKPIFKYITVAAMLFIVSGFFIINKYYNLKNTKQNLNIAQNISKDNDSQIVIDTLTKINEQIAKLDNNLEPTKLFETTNSTTGKAEFRKQNSPIQTIQENEVLADEIIEELIVNGLLENYSNNSGAELAAIPQLSKSETAILNEAPVQDNKQRKFKKISKEDQESTNYQTIIEEDFLQLPKFSGNLDKFIKDNLIYPEYHNSDSIETDIVIEFTIDTLGNCINPIIIKAYDLYFEVEAIKLINKMPRWEAAKNKSKKIDYLYNLTIHFSLSD